MIMLAKILVKVCQICIAVIILSALILLVDIGFMIIRKESLVHDFFQAFGLAGQYHFLYAGAVIATFMICLASVFVSYKIKKSGAAT